MIITAVQIQNDDNRALLLELESILGPESVATTTAERLVYETDAFTVAKQRPAAVVHPKTTKEVQAVVRLANQKGIPFVARGAGTGLSGGALVAPGGILVNISRMREILSVDLRNRRVTAQAGVVNLKLSQHVASEKYQFAPDPSSQMACTLGGNVAENAGGPHTLKYGVTTNHLLGIRMVLPDGEILDIPGTLDENAGYDLLGLIAGSEGTFGIITEVTVKLTRLPQAKWTALGVFPTIRDATQCVSDIIAAGILPAALEMIDNTAIQTVEAAFGFGFPLDAGAALIIELDGLEAGLAEQGVRVNNICQHNNASEVRVATSEEERMNLWMARKKAVGTLGRIAPSHCTQDGVVPRSKLPEVSAAINAKVAEYGLKIANIFHAGDGSLHPILLFDERDEEQVSRVMECGEEILKICIAAGGAITGEHGVGIEKMDFMPLMFSDIDMDTMAQVKQAFNPGNLCNPDKILPTRAGCTELLLLKKGVH